MFKNSVILTLFVFIVIFSVNGCKKEDNIVTPPSEHFEPEGWLLQDLIGKPVLYIFQGSIKTMYKGNSVKDTLLLDNGIAREFLINFVDTNQNILAPDNDGDHNLGFELGNTSLIEFEKDTSTIWKFKIKGKSPGNTTLKLMVMHLGHSDVITPLIPVKVK